MEVNFVKIYEIILRVVRFIIFREPDNVGKRWAYIEVTFAVRLFIHKGNCV